MKKYFSQTQFFTFLTLLLFGTACNGPFKKDFPKKTEHPKLIKTISDPLFGNVRCSIQDNEGNLWFGTTENGLFKYDGKSFNQFNVNDGLDCNKIYCILEDKDGKIWIGTEEGLCVYNGKTFDKIKIPLPKNLLPNKNPNYQNHWVYSMVQAKSGKLWFVTIDGVYIYDGKAFTQFIINESANGFLTSNDKVERILEDKAGNIWFGGRTNEGVYQYDGKIVTNFKLEELFQDGLKPKPHKWGWPQLQDKNGNIWFSNWGGAYRYDGKSFTSFGKKDGLNNITRIIEDRKGNIWFVGGDGILRYDGKSFCRFTTKYGHANRDWSILEDKSGNIWVSTKEAGLYIFDGNTFINFRNLKNSHHLAK